MPLDACHCILISMRVYVEHIICTLLNNQNISLCGQKSVGLIKESRYICKFWRYIYRKYNTGQNLLPDIDLKHKCNNINKLIILVLVVQSWLVADKLYELMKWKLTKIN